jgi:hypothetical protein
MRPPLSICAVVVPIRITQCPVGKNVHLHDILLHDILLHDILLQDHRILEVPPRRR